MTVEPAQLVSCCIELALGAPDWTVDACSANALGHSINEGTVRQAGPRRS